MRKIILVLMLAFVVSGCGATATPNPSPTEINTPLPQPTVASAPTAIPSPSAVVPTSEPPLKTNGPYFTYFRQVDGTYQLVMMDADGGGRKVVELPQTFVDLLTSQQITLDMRFVSPDGKWLAYYTGYAGNFDGQSTQTTFDLRLNLLDLNTGETQVITPLLSKDYPNNFVEAAKTLDHPYVTNTDLQYAFLAGITHALDWSPDGRYLAFAGQMDGLSSDLYVYDMEEKIVRRLTSGAEELEWIDWSLDGKWILHGSVLAFGEGMQYSVYAATPDGSSIRSFESAFEYNWLNSHQILEYENQNVFGNYNLRIVNLDTGAIAQVWDGSFHDYTVDPTNEWLIIYSDSSAIPPAQDKPGFIPGLQLINLKSHKIIQNPDPVMDPPDTFLRTDDRKIIALPEPAKADGEMIFASPDAKYWAVVIDQNVKIYAQDLTLVKEISVPAQDTKLADLLWRPDSSGLFLMYGANIYSMNIPDGNINLVEANWYGATYKWINGQ